MSEQTSKSIYQSSAVLQQVLSANNDYSNFFNSYFASPQWTEYTAYYNEKAGGPGAFAFFSATGSQAEFYHALWASGAAGSTVTLQVWRDKVVREVNVRSMDRMEYLRPSLQS